MPFIAAAVLIGGATYMKVKAEQEKTKQQVALAKYNQQVELQKAEQVRRAESVKQEQRKKDTLRMLAEQKVGFAKGGVITTTGTPLTVAMESAGRTAYDGVMARHNAEIKATQFESQADVFKFKAKSAKQAGKYAVGAALFSGATQFAGSGQNA